MSKTSILLLALILAVATAAPAPGHDHDHGHDHEGHDASEDHKHGDHTHHPSHDHVNGHDHDEVKPSALRSSELSAAEPANHVVIQSPMSDASLSKLISSLLHD